MTKRNHALPCPTVASIAFAFALLLPAISVASEPVDPSPADEHGLWLGQRVLAIDAALRNPEAPNAIGTVLELGLDSRYYIMVRGWLVMQLRGDMSISQARDGDVSPEIAARIEFLNQAIRALDLE